MREAVKRGVKWSLGGILVLVLFLGSFVTVNAGDRGVLLMFGAVRLGVLEPGLHFKLPFVQSVEDINVQVQKNQLDEEAASLDLQNVTTTVATNWNLLPSDAGWVYQNIGNEDDLNEKIIKPAVSNAVKAVAAHYNAEELIEKRDVVRSQIEEHIRQALQPYRVVVDAVSITNFQFSPEYEKAIEQKQVAQQQAQQATYELDRAKVQAQQQVVTAQAQSDSQKLLQQTLTPLLVQQQALQKWNGALPTVVGSGGVLPMVGDINGGHRQ